MKKFVALIAGFSMMAAFTHAADPLLPDNDPPAQLAGWKLVWNDEFSNRGKPDLSSWVNETGFSRNEELQWYHADNAYCKDGLLVFEGRRQRVKNPNYVAGSSDWKKNREYAEYTSACIKSPGRREFKYGRFEIRAKIPTERGAWPAIWTLGRSMEWPSCGEIDILELYLVGGKPHILANAAWGSESRWNAKWDSEKIPYTHFTAKDPNWDDKYHIWRMDWDETAIRLYLDDELLNEILLENTANGSIADYSNPFKQPHYILLNLALGGNGGDPSKSTFPMKYLVDYVRVYQKDVTGIDQAGNKTISISRNRNTFNSVFPVDMELIQASTGRLLKKEKDTQSITLDDQPAGAYILRFITENKIDTIKTTKY